MPGRKYTDGNVYRYGFNGKEKDNDVNSEGNIYDYGFRIYNPRLGRFLSVDPLSYSYPYYTPYQFAGNMPIAAIDLDGLEQYVVIYYKDQKDGDPYKVEIRSIKSGKALADQNVQRIIKKPDGISETDGNKIAKNNVLVFEVYNEGTENEQIEIVDKRRAALTSEETKINKENKKEVGKGHNLFGYPFANKSKYESQSFNDAKFYSAVQLIPPPIEDEFKSDYTTRLTGSTNDDPIATAGPTVLKDVNNDVANFKIAHPEAKVIETSVTITGKGVAKNRINAIKKELEKNGIKVKVKIDNDYKVPGTHPRQQSDQNWSTTTIIKGY